MKISIPIAAYEEGTTGEFVARAFRKLGHQADILSQYQFYDAFKSDKYDLFFCVDSGGPLNLFESSIVTKRMHKVCFWMIDYRRGKDLKNPNDRDTCKLITSQGGWVFQSQFEDFYECLSEGMERVSWLPLAADPDVWNSAPKEVKIHDVGFVGNLWDATRAQMIDTICKSGLTFSFHGHGAAKMEAAAKELRESTIGFNVSSFYGTPVAYDVNMRVFETLSCGIPLVTNYVPSLTKLFGDPLPKFLRVYHTEKEMLEVLKNAIIDTEFLHSGNEARRWILDGNTYAQRMSQALETLAVNGVMR